MRDELPLDIDLLINNFSERMIAKGARLEEANRDFEKELVNLVLNKADGDPKRAAKFVIL